MSASVSMPAHRWRLLPLHCLSCCGKATEWMRVRGTSHERLPCTCYLAPKPIELPLHTGIVLVKCLRSGVCAPSRSSAVRIVSGYLALHEPDHPRLKHQRRVSKSSDGIFGDQECFRNRRHVLLLIPTRHILLYQCPGRSLCPPISGSSSGAQLMSMLDNCEMKLKKLMSFDDLDPPCDIRLKVHEHTLRRSREIIAVTDAASRRCSSKFS